MWYVGLSTYPLTEEVSMSDMINNPPHYNQGKIEVIDFIEDQKLSYVEGNVIKYISRYKTKNGLEDLYKAKWYIDRLIMGELNKE
tara:strand:- start:237 stop:491 length:255 start_codon:yes stop_codon:yes gene_type:complete